MLERLQFSPLRGEWLHSNTPPFNLKWFQFSLPAWGAILLISLIFSNIGISILAPCVGSDRSDGTYVQPHYNFNSRSLPGERYDNLRTKRKCMGFNSRSPALGAIRDAKKWQSMSWIFQFSLPAWRASKDAHLSSFMPLFQFSLLVWGAISRNSCCRCSSWFQFSFPVWRAMGIVVFTS